LAITPGQYHALTAAVITALAAVAFLLLMSCMPRPRRHGELPWRRWARHVPRRHAAVLAVLRSDPGCLPYGLGLPGREIARRSGRRCTDKVLRRMIEAGWAERARHPGITPYHMARSGYRLTEAGLIGTARAPGAHLAGEVEELTQAMTGLMPRGRHSGPALPPGHPSAPYPIAQECTQERESW